MGTRGIVLSATDVGGAGSSGAGRRIAALPSEERRHAALIGILAGLLLAAASIAASAQSSEAPRAPRIIPTAASLSSVVAPQPVAPTFAAAPSPSTLVVPPNSTRPAPLQSKDGDPTDEIVVIGEARRLPDLGSERRARQRDQATSTRFTGTALPLYDPNDPPYRSERSLSTLEERRHGYIELFRLRFGARADDN